MKRKISLLLCVLIMTLGLAGCSDKKDAGIAYDEATLQQLTEVIVSSFSQMSDEELGQFKDLSEFQLDYTMMQSGIPISGENFVAMIDAWNAAEEECGAYISHGEYEIEEKSSSIVVSTEAQYAEREATIAITFSKDLQMESMDISAKFNVKEILTKAGLNTVLGMGTVFAVLIFLAILIGWIKYIPALFDKSSSQKAGTQVPQTSAPVSKETAEQAAETFEMDDLELVAVISAAIAAQMGTSTDGFVVRSIRRRPSNHWN